MLAKSEIVGHCIVEILESEGRQVTLPDLAQAHLSVYYDWYLRLDSGSFIALLYEELALLAKVPEPTSRAGLTATRMDAGVREFKQLTAEETQRLLANKPITEVLTSHDHTAEHHVLLVLDHMNLLSAWLYEDGNSLQFDALDEKYDLINSSDEEFRRYFEGDVCDIVGRPLPT